MAITLGIVLLVVALAMVLIARQRADGTSIMRVGQPWDIIYSALCLIPLASGLALIIAG